MITNKCKVILVTGEFFAGSATDGNMQFTKIVCEDSSEKEAIGNTVTINNNQIKYTIFLE